MLGFFLILKILSLNSMAILTSNFLLISKNLMNSWVGWVFYATLYLAFIGFFIVFVLQVKSLISKPKPNKQNTWEAVWTVIPLLILIALWWFF